MPDVRWLRCDIKSIQLLPNVLAKQAADERGAIDAIMIRDGVVTEGSHANVIGVLDGVLRTHQTNHLILQGSRATVVLEIAPGSGFRWSKRHSARTRSNDLDEAFLTGTTTDVMPIVRVDDRPVGNGTPGPITTRLVTEFRAYLDAACGAADATSVADVPSTTIFALLQAATPHPGAASFVTDCGRTSRSARRASSRRRRRR